MKVLDLDLAVAVGLRSGGRDLDRQGSVLVGTSFDDATRGRHDVGGGDGLLCGSRHQGRADRGGQERRARGGTATAAQHDLRIIAHHSMFVIITYEVAR